jgi:hypothetical protein
MIGGLVLGAGRNPERLHNIHAKGGALALGRWSLVVGRWSLVVGRWSWVLFFRFLHVLFFWRFYLFPSAIVGALCFTGSYVETWTVLVLVLIAVGVGAGLLLLEHSRVRS